MAEYTLPDLDWDYGALEPHISGQINELHHSKHHATYVKGANAAVTALEEARSNDDHSAILLNEKNLAFNLGGHVNHTVWWKILSPNGGDKPTGDLAAAIDDAFGSFDALKSAINDGGVKRFGSGWSWLVWDGTGLSVYSTPNQDSPIMQSHVPLLGIDVWEHAYYLSYQNKRPAYLEAWWNVVNWPEVERNFAEAQN